MKNETTLSNAMGFFNIRNGFFVELLFFCDVGSWNLQCYLTANENHKTNCDVIKLLEGTKKGSTVPLIIVFNPTVFSLNMRLSCARGPILP